MTPRQFGHPSANFNHLEKPQPQHFDQTHSNLTRWPVKVSISNYSLQPPKKEFNSRFISENYHAVILIPEFY